MNAVLPNIAGFQQFNPANIAASTGLITEDVVFPCFNRMPPDMRAAYFGRHGFLKKLIPLGLGEYLARKFESMGYFFCLYCFKVRIE